jgi:hypothetical protein
MKWLTHLNLVINMLTKNNTIHLIYAREYYDSEEMNNPYFNSHNTIFRNVHFSKLDTLKRFKDKIKKYCDKNYKEQATNFTGNSSVEILTGDEYYETYGDVYGYDNTGDDIRYVNDYGQLSDKRQFFKKDYNTKIIESYKQQIMKEAM